MFRLVDGEPQTVRLSVPLSREIRREHAAWPPTKVSQEALAESHGCKAVLPDSHFQFLFDNAVHTLMLLSAGDIVPGPYTYKRFWFRDACLMLHALLCLGDFRRAHRLMAGFFPRQDRNGYFRSQEE